ncbi:4-alpha-glucanotransferase [Oceaniferula spumae]|uniref:4-alpha-glucanotransferase n=1 Tax=Oceaniferula spumae TaxID=2979115 RepID=A0AAT9FJ97_9BACT
MQRLRRFGVLIPVFSLKRDHDLGIGDTLAMKEAVDWASAHDIGFLQLLPINETGSDSSPYNAISSIALDPVLIAVDEIPGITAEAIALEDAACVHENLVDYSTAGAAKWRLLKAGYEIFRSKGGPTPEFDAFRKAEQDWLVSYTKYRWLMELAGTEEWEHWPEEYNTSEKADAYLATLPPEDVEQSLTYYAWVQWHAFSQWRDLRNYAASKNVKLMGDIPIGISYSSADVFFEPQWFDLTLSGGSPPETVFKDDAFACQWGQNWGIPLYNWEELEKHDFSWWRRRIEKLTDVFHIFRIDHILGFYRIFSFPWRPARNAEFLGLTDAKAKKLTGGELPKFHPHPDDTVAHKKANLEAGDKYLKVVLEAAGDGEVVGEDLGCVPDYVRPHLAKLGIAGFKICHWEELGEGQAVPGSEYPECSFATYATHDHDSIPALWNALLDMLNGLEHEGAMRGLALLSDFAGLPKGETAAAYSKYGPVVKWALLEKLVMCRSDYAAIMITDLIDSTKRINIPGTVGGENWRYRLPWKLDDMPDPLRRECQRLKEQIHLAGRD